jgi:imidazolonepropionase-like amidohydrolase
MEAIISATAYGGELMLHPNELGKVVPGAYADLILVNGDPLEDITLLSHKENLDVIIMVRFGDIVIVVDALASVERPSAQGRA